LSFDVKKQSKKALRGGVLVEISRLNLIKGNKNIPSDTPLNDVMTSFDLVFDKIVEQTLKASRSDQDKLQIVIRTEHEKADVNDTGMKHPIRSEMIDVATWRKNEDEKSRVLTKLFSKIEPYDDITLGDNIIIETILIKAKISDDDDPDNDISASGRCCKLPEKSVYGNSVYRVENKEDHMCLARAAVVSFAHHKYLIATTPEEAKTLLAESVKIRRASGLSSHQANQAFAVLLAVDIDPQEPTKNSDIEKIAMSLCVKIKVIPSDNLNAMTVYGDSNFEHSIYLLREKIFACEDKNSPDYHTKFSYHYDAIIDMAMFRQTSFYCTFCDVAVKHRSSHKCKDIVDAELWCYSCFERNCFKSNEEKILCAHCLKFCRNSDCLKKHKDLNICGHVWCPGCRSKILKKKIIGDQFESSEAALSRHECKVVCRNCHREKGSIHKCYMTREGLKERCEKILFIDFETDQSSGVHVPIYCFMQWIEFSYDKATGIERVVRDGEKEFGISYSTFSDVGDFLFSGEFKDFTIIGHNMKGFDGCFLLRYLIEKNIETKIIANGLKLTSVSVPQQNIRIIDSLNFLQMSLAALPKALGIEEKVKNKGYFPHFFTTPENLTYKGRLPEPEDYGIYDMKNNSEFTKWYLKTQKAALLAGVPAFDFERDLKIYCKQDVVILMAACLKFREIVLNITSGIVPQEDVLGDDETFLKKHKFILENKLFNPNTFDEGECDNVKGDEFDFGTGCDPFSYLTLPGVCFAVFKSKFLKRRSIAQINPSGYENFRYSLKSCEYLQYLNIRNGNEDITHSLNSGDGKEVKLLGRYRVDGYDAKTKTVYEFHGCFWHGCERCVKNRDEIQPVQKLTYDYIYQRTKAREEKLRNAGFNVQVMWECEWENLKKSDDSVKAIVSKIHIKTKLNPRDAFRGGRVETGLIYYNINSSKGGKGLRHVDIRSLYPAVNCFEYYPVGHPEIILNNFDKSIDKYFGLIQCSVLAPQNIKHGVLPVHINGKLLFPLCRTCAETAQVEYCKHSESERMFYGVWVSEELKLAISEGYKISQIFCVHHFERKTKDLFSPYIQTFYKIKLAASGRPENETPEQLLEFIEKTKEKEGICMCPEEFKFNAGLRSVGKLCCNCMWGRFGMRDSFSNVTLCHDLESLNKILCDDSFEINTVRQISENCVAVLHSTKSLDLLNYSNNTNVYVAVFTTAYARIRLFKAHKASGDRFVYEDTDSLFEKIDENQPEHLNIGEFMGEWASELKPGEVIIEFVSGGPKIYGYRTSFGKVVIKVKGFHLNFRNSKAFSFENLKKVILSFCEKNMDPQLGRVRLPEQSLKNIRKNIYEDFHGKTPFVSSAVATDDAISVFDVSRIHRDNTWQLFARSEQKMYTVNFDKRIIQSDLTCVPHGYIPN
jgi:hypothetical protein